MNESSIWIFLFGTLSVYPFFGLRHVPVIGRMKISFWRIMLLASVIMVAQGLSFLWLAKLYPFGSPILIWNRKLFMFLYVFLTFIFTKDSKAKTLFMDFFMIGIIMAVIDVAYVLDRTWFAGSFAIAPYRTDVLVRGTVTLLIYLPLYVLLKKVLRPIMAIKSMTVWRYITAISFVFAITSTVTTMEAFGHQISPVVLIIRFSVLCGSVLVCALLGKVVKQTEAAVIVQEKSKQAERLLALQGAQYEALTKNIEQTRAVKHDLHHLLAAISTMLEGGEYDKLREFVGDYRQWIPTDKNMMLCENYAANSIISHYITLAHEEGVATIDVRCVLTKDSGVADMDLCVLLGNLLENAIEGCKTVPIEKRKIKIRIATHVGELMLAVDNTFDGIATIENGEYLSRKRAGKQKGIGLSSVAVVAEKYGGELLCEQKDGLFMVSVKMVVGVE